MTARVLPVAAAVLACLALDGVPAAGQEIHPFVFQTAAELRQQSRQDALTIKDAYRPLLGTATFADEDGLRDALADGRLVPLSSVQVPHLQLRIWGHSPSVEGDIDRRLYESLRPSTLGMLLDLASRIEHGPIELTSAVRTAAYQRALTGRNANAVTDVPTHVMGYAIDIGLRYASEATVRDLRKALNDMRDAGDIYFIAERNQATFHVVPALDRVRQFEMTYAQTLAAELAPIAEPVVPTLILSDIDAPEQQTGFFGRLWEWVAGVFW